MTDCDNKLFLFVHLAKTGGTTLRRFFAQALVPQRTYIHLGPPTYAQQKAAGIPPFAERSAEERAQARVICGHDVTCRTHLLVPEKVPHYVVFLREPALRLVSYYNYEMKRRQQKEQPILEFEEWYRQGRTNNITLGWLYGVVCPEMRPRHVGPTVYNEVVKRLEEFWFVGCSEHLNRDFPLLLRFIGLSGALESANVSGVDYPKLLEPDAQFRNRLNSDNELDFNLYMHFKNRLDGRVQQLKAELDGVCDDQRAPGQKTPWFRSFLSSETSAR